VDIAVNSDPCNDLDGRAGRLAEAVRRIASNGDDMPIHRNQFGDARRTDKAFRP
jgi:hypothetical protein